MVSHVSTSLGGTEAFGSTFTVATPTGLVVDDFLTAFVVVSVDEATAATGPAGWTTLGDFISQGSDASSPYLSVFYKAATTTEVNASTFTFGKHSSSDSVCHLSAWRNVDLTNPIALSALDTLTPNSTTHTAPTRTTTVANTMYLIWNGYQQYVAAKTQTIGAISGAGWAGARTGFRASVFNFAALDYENRASAGAIDTRTVVSSGSQSAGRILTVGLRDKVVAASIPPGAQFHTILP